MTKSSEVEQARRVNVTISLLRRKASSSEVLALIVRRYSLSRRQACRYLQQARQTASPLPIPEEKTVFTVKLPRRLIAQVRGQARRQRCSISSWVAEALRQSLQQLKGHG